MAASTVGRKWTSNWSDCCCLLVQSSSFFLDLLRPAALVGTGACFLSRFYRGFSAHPSRTVCATMGLVRSSYWSVTRHSRHLIGHLLYMFLFEFFFLSERCPPQARARVSTVILERPRPASLRGLADSTPVRTAPRGSAPVRTRCGEDDRPKDRLRAKSLADTRHPGKPCGRKFLLHPSVNGQRPG